MAHLTATHPTLIGTLWPGETARPLKWVVLALLGTALLTLSAKIQVPFYPVPQTMQTFAVLVIAMVYGPRLGAATLLLYLAEGAAGLPVFAGTPEKGIGLAYMIGPTGGYLLGFLFATLLCGWLAERGWDRRVATTALAMVLGNIVIYVPGLLWLGSLLGWDKPILEWGLTPFIYGDLAKLALAAAVLPFVWRLAKRR
jgi:biotin transport system substrate-specific component